MKTAYFERFTLPLPDDAVVSCSHQGACDEDVAFWETRVDRPDDITPDNLRAELKGYGAWDDEELADDDANWRRILWIAAGNIQDGM